MPDETSLTGKGRDILLPKHGNPFQQSVDISADPSADFAARNPSSHDDRNVLPNTTDPLPDLAPSDVAALFKDSGAAVSSGAAAASPMSASPTSSADEIHRASSMSSTDDPDTKVYEGSWLQAPSNITATGQEEALPAPDADDVIPAVGILSTPKPTASVSAMVQPVSTSKTPSTVSAPASSSGLRLPPLATSSVSSMPSPSATMTPSTSTPKPDSPSTPATPLVDRLTPPASSTSPASAPAKPADAAFKPTNPFATVKPTPAPQPEVAKAPAPDEADDDDNSKDVLASYAAGSAPSQPSRASSISRTSSLSPYSDPFTSSGEGPILGTDLPRPPVQEQVDMLKLLVTDDRLEKLWQRIDTAEDKAIHDNNLGPKERSAAMDNIRGARNLVLGGRPNYEDALRYVVEVEADLMQVNRLRSWSMTYGVWLFVYNMLWLVGLAALWVNVAGIVAMFPQGQSGNPEPAFFITILCGGLGGVTGALRSMWVHIAKDRDFDPQHMWWYIINPILGCVLAIFGYWTVQLGLVAVSGEGASGNGAFVLYVLGFLVGFQQNVAYQLVEQAIKMFFKRDDSSKSSSTASGGAKPSVPGIDMKPKP